ncbi:hypothetical protein SDC9_143137 [bioreactor metagenome]|uniref:Uncharacterized protein n=1 Tax=bioreactor metagenome TaxID=1076179 RepID=A0A645E344_9ZZZZ
MSIPAAAIAVKITNAPAIAASVRVRRLNCQKKVLFLIVWQMVLLMRHPLPDLRINQWIQQIGSQVADKDKKSAAQRNPQE